MKASIKICHQKLKMVHCEQLLNFELTDWLRGLSSQGDGTWVIPPSPGCATLSELEKRKGIHLTLNPSPPAEREAERRGKGGEGEK